MRVVCALLLLQLHITYYLAHSACRTARLRWWAGTAQCVLLLLLLLLLLLFLLLVLLLVLELLLRCLHAYIMRNSALFQL